MSDDGSNDNVFARWSRRKLSARQEEPARGDETPSPEVAAEEVGAASQEPEAAETETDEPSEPLPRIEDLTAESDLSAFLRKGVPMALKSAAMRKMWSLDPGIRDYVGPSEYAWDFNQPGSMGGFGPLDAKETVVGFLSKTVRAMEPDAEPTAGGQPDAFPEQPAVVRPDTVADADTPEPSAVTDPLEPDPPPDAADPPEAAFGDAEPAKPRHSTDDTRRSQLSEPVVGLRHGGAMPR